LSRKRRPRRALRALRALRRGPRALRVAIALVALVILSFAVNWMVQVGRKPAELFFPVSGVLSKTPAETWRSYAAIFREHATAVITPEFLAALAQIEGAGNPVAQTYWRWRLTAKPFEVYRPASSAVGMYQITDETFQQEKRYCIHDHVAVADGPWYQLHSCWFNGLYLRVLPSDAVEMTSAYLDRQVARVLESQRIPAATLRQKQDLAAVIHLCGAAAGAAYAAHGFRASARQRCGEHDLGRYLARIDSMKRAFFRLAREH